MKKGKRRTVLIALGLVVALCAGYLLNVFVAQPAQVQADVQELKSIKTEPVPVSSSASVAKMAKKQEQVFLFQRLQTVNADIKGWLTVPGTNIDYPVLQSSKTEPDYYLHRSYKKRYAEAGSIYLQYDCSPETSRNTVVYGHHMLYDAMFTELPKYNYFSFWKAHQTFLYENASGKCSCEIFAVLHVSPDSFSFNRTQFADDADFARFLSALKNKAIYNTEVPVTAKDKIMMLVTCSYEQHNGRTIIVGKQNLNGG